MINRLLDKKNKKDKFIIDKLLTYLAQHIEDEGDEDTIEQIASMYVFPYKEIDGIRIGSLREYGISWYFNKDEKKDIVSSGSYRIIDLSMLNENQAKEFRKTFHEYCGIEEFSDTAVIKDLLEKMSKETEYSRQWWICAYDVFKLWNEEDFNLSLTKATVGMKNKSFLFLENSYTWSLRDKLLEYDVVKDLLDGTAHSLFWDKLNTKSDKNKAIYMLEKMGVPFEFIANDEINFCIRNFLEEIAEEIEFPVKYCFEEYEKCELCHDILYELYENHMSEFESAILNEDLKMGLVVKNLNDEFVPLSWDLFFSEYEFEDIQNEDVCEDENHFPEKTDNKLEIHHIDVILYDREYLELFENIHDFANVDGSMDEYLLGIEVEEIEFYKWIWNYSQHEELVENILFYYSAQEELYSKGDIAFALEVLACENVYNKGYKFEFKVDVETAFEYNEVINRISKPFSNITCKVSEKGKLLDKNLFLSQLMQAIKNANEYQKIIIDDIWDRVYIVDGKAGMFYGNYVCCKNEDDERRILLWKSDSDESYIVGLTHYISEFFEVEVSIADLSEINWKKAYINLINGIRSFVNYHSDIMPTDEVYKYIIDLNDVKTFGDEKAIWLRLKEQMKKLMELEGEDTPPAWFGSRDFLKAKYNGRCQICGNIVPKNEQDTYFFTYRIIPKSKNPLADMKYNLFCLCPTCHGALRYGRVMGQDMSDIVEKASMYASYIEDKINSGEMEDDFPCLVQELVDSKVELEGFCKPIVCNVIVNGKERKMAFSWEHFIKMAFVFSDINDFEEEDDFVYEKVDETEDYDPIPINHMIPRSIGHPRGYEQWHGTEWVSGHYRNRNGRTEWVSGHWRTR